MRFLLSISLLVPLGAGAVQDLKIDMRDVDGTPAVTADAVLDAPPERIWDIIDRCADYKTTLVSIRESKELAREGDRRRCEVTVEMPFPLPNLTAVTEAEVAVKPGESWRRAWHLVEGDYRQNAGSWTLTPAKNGGTHVTYAIVAQPKMPVPAFALRMAQNQAIPKLFEKLEAGAQGRTAPVKSPLSE